MVLQFSVLRACSIHAEGYFFLVRRTIQAFRSKEKVGAQETKSVSINNHFSSFLQIDEGAFSSRSDMYRCGEVVSLTLSA